MVQTDYFFMRQAVRMANPKADPGVQCIHEWKEVADRGKFQRLLSLLINPYKSQGERT
jgi:hypothetical protein